MNLKDAQAYCQDLTQKSGSSFYHAFKFLDAPQRIAMNALYAFCREVDDVVDEINDEHIARKELEKWRKRVDELNHGVTSHPVTIALADAMQTYDLHTTHMQELIDGMEMDLDDTRYPTFSDLQLYCYRAASVVGLMSAEIFGYTNAQTTKYAHDLGLAFQLTNVIRDVAEDSQRGRIYIPQEDLDTFNVDPAHLALKTTTPEAKKLFEFQINRAQQYYEQAESKLPEEDRFSQRAGLIMSAVYQRILQEIKRKDYAILDSRISVSKFRKAWVAWQAAQREKQRYKKRIQANS